MTLFDDLLSRWAFRPIPDCPGRYVLRGGDPHLTPAQILGREVTSVEYPTAATQDRVLVTQFEGGALLTFAKRCGTHVHTLNTPEGLARRLAKLG